MGIPSCQVKGPAAERFYVSPPPRVSHSLPPSVCLEEAMLASGTFKGAGEMAVATGFDEDLRKAPRGGSQVDLNPPPQVHPSPSRWQIQHGWTAFSKNI